MSEKKDAQTLPTRRPLERPSLPGCEWVRSGRYGCCIEQRIDTGEPVRMVADGDAVRYRYLWAAAVRWYVNHPRPRPEANK